MFNKIEFDKTMTGYNIETSISNNIISCKIKSKNARIKFNTTKSVNSLQLPSHIFSICSCNTGLIDVYNKPTNYPNFTITVYVDGVPHNIQGVLHHYTYTAHYFLSFVPLISYKKPSINLLFKGETEIGKIDVNIMKFDWCYADINDVYEKYIDNIDLTLFIIKKM